MPEMNGIEATAEISRRFPETSVIAISMHKGDHWIKEMLAAGANGYLLKDAESEEIVNAIITVRGRQAYYSKTTVSCMFQSLAKSTADFSGTLKPNFTNKELTVIKLMCQEYSNKEIASNLKTSVRSVESARERIQQKIGSKNMIGIVVYAIKNGIMLLHEMS